MIYTPSIIHETSEGLSRIPIADCMLQRREIWLTGEINSELANSVISQLLHLDAEDGDITVYINSPGGNVVDGLAIYDVMQSIHCPVTTVCVGCAASMGAILFAAGTHRLMLPHAEVMIHDPLTTGMSGSAMSIQESCNRLLDFRKTLCGILAHHTGKDIDAIYAVTAKDTYFAADAAVKFGLADEIIEKIERRSAS